LKAYYVKKTSKIGVATRHYITAFIKQVLPTFAIPFMMVSCFFFAEELTASAYIIDASSLLIYS
jgi:hypothetical protein